METTYKAQPHTLDETASIFGSLVWSSFAEQQSDDFQHLKNELFRSYSKRFSFFFLAKSPLRIQIDSIEK